MATEKDMLTRQSELERQIAELKGKLEISEKEKTEAQEMATSLAEASGFMGNSEEQPTGNTIEVEVCANPWVRDEKKQIFKNVKMPTYYYTINIPLGSGTNLMTNGIAYYHGVTYEVDMDTLRDLKSRAARCWDHEKSIHSDNEAAFTDHMKNRRSAVGLRG